MKQFVLFCCLGLRTFEPPGGGQKASRWEDGPCCGGGVVGGVRLVAGGLLTANPLLTRQQNSSRFVFTTSLRSEQDR